MGYIADSFREALHLIVGLDEQFVGIVVVSIMVSAASACLATIAGVPFGITLARKNFPGRAAVVTVVNTLMSLPTVVVGLLVYSFLSRRGPMGSLGWLFTKKAMILGQFVLAFPIVTGLTVAAVRSLDKRIEPTIVSLGARPSQGITMFLLEARFGILAAVVAGFGRVFAEVGISMMLGGNIAGETRNITTAIALETSKGEFGIGIALGIVLLTVALAINVLFALFQKRAK